MLGTPIVPAGRVTRLTPLGLRAILSPVEDLILGCDDQLGRSIVPTR
jgi:hypothetical protein